MKNIRLWLPGIALAGLISAGCMLISGQFTVVYTFADPINVVSPSALAGQVVDLNTISEYKDHKDNLKAVVDLAVLGKFTNLTSTNSAIEIWIVPSPGAALTNDAAVRASGQKIWGPLNVAGNSSVNVTWDQSAALFTGRQALITEVKGDGVFALYALANGPYSFRINKGAFIAVISAGR
ncbi:MAG: hypothetical protein ABIU54_08890 [Candidatus Eisenbacteria bacterium]